MSRTVVALIIAVAIAIAVVLAVAPSASADPMLGDADRGHDFAKAVCAECHRVEPGASGVIPDLVRPFEAIARDPKYTELSLRVFLRSSHERMPNFMLTQEETDDIVAYILSMRPE